ncbi:MAG: tRNA (adenosine(37)-N6)-threonylcarbamoyltransferase complex transferase subunit TsaD [bacterium]|nr:tRNA (adenosine(37)-N6)-threonylcarbamoyltransferase complex transferase subunit TsaD [bacterium]MDZ4285412.1 tRNA (adenosine(37)-N6)-threonylcarbamoyltransferase complex transferase subunit TsaD [Candidatus Sungbacteria bacterium]
MKILAIETSCDETSVAIIETSGARRQPSIRVLVHFVSSQIELHAQFGGVVPNLARREHERLLVPLIVKALKKSKISARGGSASGGKSQNKIEEILEREPDLVVEFKKKIVPLSIPDIDAIAVTNGPGLAPALWVGVNCAKALSLVWKKPIIPMNHMKGHIFSALLQCGKKNDQFSARGGSAFGGQIPNFKFPLLALLVSGGHTELVLMKKFGSYEIIGETLDDAAGEAFDKVARMLDLGYPGGPAISAQAEKNFQFPISNFQIRFPRPMIQSKDFNFSFSGLKTSVLYFIRDLADKKSVRAYTPAIAKEFQDAVVDVLVTKTIRAAQLYKAKTIIVGGGVSANKLLRERLAVEVKDKCKGVDFFVPHPSVTGDNALMIALAAVLDGNKKAPDKIGAEGNMRL